MAVIILGTSTVTWVLFLHSSCFCQGLLLLGVQPHLLLLAQAPWGCASNFIFPVFAVGWGAVNSNLSLSCQSQSFFPILEE